MAPVPLPERVGGDREEVRLAVVADEAAVPGDLTSDDQAPGLPSWRARSWVP